MREPISDKILRFLGEEAAKVEAKYDADADVANLSANINNINKQLSDEKWSKKMAELDAEFKINLSELSETMAELARKMNATFADFTKSYWNSVSDASGKKKLKGKVMTAEEDPSVTDDSEEDDF